MLETRLLGKPIRVYLLKYIYSKYFNNKLSKLYIVRFYILLINEFKFLFILFL